MRSKLMADKDVKSLDIKVKVRKGEVLLSGFADSQLARRSVGRGSGAAVRAPH